MPVPVARGAPVVGALQRERSQAGAEGLGAVTLEPRRLAATATPDGSLPLPLAGIEALRDEAPHEFQGEAAGGLPESLKVHALAQVRAEQPVEFGTCGGGELRRAGFFSPSSAASLRAAWMRLWQNLLADIDQFGDHPAQALALGDLGAGLLQRRRGNGTRAGLAADPGRDDPLGAVAAGPGLGALVAGAAAFVVALDERAGAQVSELVDLRQQFLAVILQRRIA